MLLELISESSKVTGDRLFVVQKSILFLDTSNSKELKVQIIAFIITAKTLRDSLA